mmetsp:Transcript_117952/g.279989  ORF Transcript_117952/g.279989 Transcript_117952/m.279989 type:complete len:220 (+) Transcript_117952:207-866(+)
MSIAVSLDLDHLGIAAVQSKLRQAKRHQLRTKAAVRKTHSPLLIPHTDREVRTHHLLFGSKKVCRSIAREHIVSRGIEAIRVFLKYLWMDLIQEAAPVVTNDNHPPIFGLIVFPPLQSLQIPHLAPSKKWLRCAAFIARAHDLNRVAILLAHVNLILISDAFLLNFLLDDLVEAGKGIQNSTLEALQFLCRLFIPGCMDHHHILPLQCHGKTEEESLRL